MIFIKKIILQYYIMNSIIRGVKRSLKNRKDRKQKKKLSKRHDKTRKNRKNIKNIKNKKHTTSHNIYNSNSNSKSYSKSKSKSKSKSIDPYVYKTKSKLYERARNIKRSNKICYEAISRMDKDGVIRFLRKYE